jgi:hypothetical protein
MRIMNLPNIPVGAQSPEERIAAYLDRLKANEALWPAVSILLTAYLAWPNDEERRNSFVATHLLRLSNSSGKEASEPVASHASIPLEAFGGLNAVAEVAFDQLADDIGQVQSKWLITADIFQLIVDMGFDERAVLHRGPSISKAIDLCEIERGLPGHSQLRGAWSEFRDVAHILTAGAHLAHEGLAHANCSDEASILKAIWTAPDGILALAYGLQEFGLQPKSIRKERSVLPGETLWRIPEGCQPERSFVVFRRLTQAQLDFLNSRRVA